MIFCDCIVGSFFILEFEDVMIDGNGENSNGLEMLICYVCYKKSILFIFV